MARFTFELEGILRQRKNAEHVAQRDVAVAMQSLVEAQDKLRRLDESVKSVSDDVRMNHLTGEIDVNFITAHRRYLAGMERLAIEVARSIGEAQAKVDAAQRLLIEASKQRKTIEKLREKQMERWSAEQAKKESENLDEAGMQIAYEHIVEEMRGREN